MSRRHRPFKRPSRTQEEAVERAEAGADRSQHWVSISRLAEIIGRDRGTIADWIGDKGCPVADHGSSGEATLLDPAEVFRWRERFVRDEEAAKVASGETAGGAPMKPSDLVKLEDLKIKRLAVGQKAEVLVPRYVVEGAFELALGLIRQTIMAIPERLVRDMAGYPEKQRLEWREKALKQCRTALAEGAKAIQDTLPGFDPPQP
ncbi:hypothetical protein SAMN06297251_10151 [Fulvimarina manganoxydans]|uniref:Phage DNA packaging protein, Nu1 subunit of terminase n=1 Tax=Fulvimarina manganoxydans TaxID=937218 RepID=A0A1W1Y8Y8_9HYPH|nr:hypothetical protein [Fulvimarina manganoxydans]SMC32594.1 hypothetical protein SAMN06297251_10151 [Fulvimarina manganoxydans]